MRFEQLRIGLLTAGMTIGLAGMTYAQGAAPAPAAGEQPKTETKPAEGDAAPAAGAERGREGRGRRGEGRGANPARMLQRMQESFNDLNLSDEQKTKIQAIVDTAKPQLEALARETESLEPRQRAKKMRETVQPVREELMSVLDETQRQKLREKMEAARAAGGGGGPGGPGGLPMLQNLKANLEQLGLRENQKKQVDALIADTEKQFAAIRAEAGQGNAGGEARAKFREVMQANRKRLNEILTPEQQQKLRDLSPRRGQGAGGKGRPPERAGNAPEGTGNAPEGAGNTPEGEQREPL